MGDWWATYKREEKKSNEVESNKKMNFICLLFSLKKEANFAWNKWIVTPQSRVATRLPKKPADHWRTNHYYSWKINWSNIRSKPMYSMASRIGTRISGEFSCCLENSFCGRDYHSWCRCRCWRNKERNPSVINEMNGYFEQDFFRFSSSVTVDVLNRKSSELRSTLSANLLMDGVWYDLNSLFTEMVCNIGKIWK